jgi:transposase, IS5 family
MSLKMFGLESKPRTVTLSVTVSKTDPLIQLCSLIDWKKMADMVLADLQATTAKGKWYAGRGLNLRTHLGVLVLQTILKSTDRVIEQRILESPRLQVFTGRTMVKLWRCPDHTKIQHFRSRLKPATISMISNYLVTIACELGFGDPSKMDLDSTIQEANITYPSDARLLRQFAEKCEKIISNLRDLGCRIGKRVAGVFKRVKKESVAYFFRKKGDLNTDLTSFYESVKRAFVTALKEMKRAPVSALKKASKIFHQTASYVIGEGKLFFQEVKHFIRYGKSKKGKRLSHHAKEVDWFRKSKLGKKWEFGRNVQLGRIGGNFFVSMPMTDVRMEDRASFQKCVKVHEDLFGEGVLDSVATDRGYYTRSNEAFLKKKGIPSEGLQKPGQPRVPINTLLSQELRDRRSGIEPLIAHVKDFGLRKSRMKSDVATKASVYRSILGFNCHQMMRFIMMTN